MRQYIGARYMPKFVGPYSVTTAYEALSVVDDGMGTSYVANKPVPAGTPLTDTNYWAIYGASSGAILDLQTRMTDAENDIKDINDKISKNIIMIADSYGVEGSPFATHSFYYYLNNLFANSNYNVTLHTSAGRGASFGRPDDDGIYKYITQLISISGSITDKNAITDIMIIGGYNDLLTYPMSGLVTDAETVQGMEDFKDYANANYPNAKLHFIPVGSNSASGTSQYYANYNIKFAWFVDNLFSHGFTVHENAPFVIATKYYHLSDNIHPSLEGQAEIAKLLFNYIVSGYTHINRRHYFSEADVTPATDITLSNLNMSVIQNDGMKHIAISRVNFACPSTSVSLSSWLPICTLPADCIVDDMTRTQLNIRPSNITYGPVLRVNDGVLEIGAETAQTITGLDLRGNDYTFDALEA